MKPDISSYTHFKGSGVYSADGGTSAATPVVAGVVAAVRSVFPYDPATPASDPAAVRNMLTKTAEDRGLVGYDFEYGWGIVNGCRLAEALCPKPPEKEKPCSCCCCCDNDWDRHEDCGCRAKSDDCDSEKDDFDCGCHRGHGRVRHASATATITVIATAVVVPPSRKSSPTRAARGRSPKVSYNRSHGKSNDDHPVAAGSAVA
jgi:hypothetical protein